jgi:hypothetical protein
VVLLAEPTAGGGVGTDGVEGVPFMAGTRFSRMGSKYGERSTSSAVARLSGSGFRHDSSRFTACSPNGANLEKSLSMGGKAA